jgi:hypothetical protein
MIRRAPHRRHFVQVDNRAVEDPRLSLRAKGLLVYLLSRPDNWRAHPTQVALTTSDSVGIVRSCLAELKRFGYAKLERIPIGKGRFGGTEWLIDELPFSDELPLSELRKNRDSEKPSFGQAESRKNAALNYTEEENNTEKKTNSVRARAREIEEIWQAYPRKAGKPAAIKAISRAIAREGFDKILAATNAFAEARPDPDDHYTPWPQKWFNNARYNDPPSTWRPAPKPMTAVERNKRKGALQEQLNIMFSIAKDRQLDNPRAPLYTEAEKEERSRLKKEMENL